MGEASTPRLAPLRGDLEGPDPSPTERLYAERAALCGWLVHFSEATYAVAKGLNVRQGQDHRRQIDRAHARFLSALKTMATVRKLAVPALQVNIGNNQVNTLGPIRKGRSRPTLDPAGPPAENAELPVITAPRHGSSTAWPKSG